MEFHLRLNQGPAPSLPSVVERALVFALLVGVYLLGAYFSLATTTEEARVALIWIPSGLALGFLYLQGLWLAPAVFLAVLLINLHLGVHAGMALGFAIANCLSVSAAAAILRGKADFDPGLRRSRDVVLLGIAVGVGALLAGAMADISVVLALPGESLGASGFYWALAESLSMLALCPFMLTSFSGRRFSLPWPRARRIEFGILSGFILLFAYLVFLKDPGRVGFLHRSAALLPVLLWAALRFNPRILSAYLSILAITAVVGAFLGRGAFAEAHLSRAVVEAQGYMSLFCLSSLLIASVSFERARLARERESHLLHLANSIPALVWTTNAQGDATVWNDHAHAYFGFDRRAGRGEFFEHYVHPDDREGARRKWEACVASGKPYEHEVRFRRSDGAYEWFTSKANPLRDDGGRIQQWFGASMSIEQQRRAIMELEEERDIRDRMVFTLSHDIRNPLAVIDAGAQVLLKAPAPPELTRSFLEQISESVARANRMIVDLLDANRFRGGDLLALNVGPEDLMALLGKAVRGLRTVHGDIFALEGPAQVPGYWAGEELRRIVENLCANAVKYGDQARGVRITVKENREAGEVSFSVHNFGSVIEEQDIARIFRLFHRTRGAQSGERMGWGIGLTLVQGFTAAHGGRVEVASGPEQGTTFTVHLPCDARAAVLLT